MPQECPSPPSGKIGGASIYLHIPFCKQACYYCDFHFSTNTKKKDELVLALAKEITLRKCELNGQTIETIYFGGGTPSLLSNAEIEFLIAEVYTNFNVAENPEITLEANPDDLTQNRILELSKTPINRLSIGIQSFFETDLKRMNRAHNAEEAKQCLQEATRYFKNITIDLIYGIPGLSNARWLQNIETALAFNIPHISSYALTVEPKTALEHLIKKGEINNVNEQQAHEQFYLLIEKLKISGFVHYELSNFGKPEYFSKHNTSYWQGKPYLGIGPSAHSFNGRQRSWNISNNSKYIKAIQNTELPIETETLTVADKYNEYIMTGLRTIWGVSLAKVETAFGADFKIYLLEQAEKHIKAELLYIEADTLFISKKGKFLSDGIAADLFKV
ncbi:MAG: radical SAM family heme chaperone HemW [Flavobacteriaceae bacterium]